MTIRVGVGGWTYEPWRGVFYPEGLPQKRELEYAAQQLTAIEFNATFYGRQKPASYRNWAKAAPDGFKPHATRRRARRWLKVAVPSGRFLEHPLRALDQWADKARAWAEGGRDAFCYFISGAKVRNPAATQALIKRLK